MKIMVALLVFTVIIVIHELGHFLLAKKNGIFVREFSVGMGPRLFTLARFAETEGEKKKFRLHFFGTGDYFEEREGWRIHTRYSLKLLPIGGSCAMLGEDEALEDDRAFNQKGVFARMSVIVAGPFFNFLLAFLFALFIIGGVGYDPAEVSYIEDHMPLSETGLAAGDTVTAINGSRIHFSREITTYMFFHPLGKEEISLSFLHNGTEKTVTVRPKLTEEGSYRLGFAYTNYRKKTDAIGVIKNSFYEVKYWIVTTVRSLGMMLNGKVSKDEIAGPVGVVNIIGDTYEEAKQEGVYLTLLNLFNISILLSANLGVMNLLPLPALDGGRLVFLIIEAVRGKPVPREKEGMVHLVGLIALMVLMVFVMYNDISRLITG